jgi:hypothetical protein
MSTINRLSSVDALQPGDQIPVWDSSNGDTRKASLTTLLAFIEANFADPDYSTRIVAPSINGFNVDIGDTGDSIWLIVNPVASYINGSVSLPSSTYAVNDQEITVVFTAPVESFSVTGAGTTVLGTPTYMGAYESFRVRYNASQLTWYTLNTTAYNAFDSKTFYKYGTDAAASDHPAISIGHILETTYFDSNMALNSGGCHIYTGVTTPGSAGTWPNPDGFFYDSVGKQFKLEGVSNVAIFGAIPYASKVAAIAGVDCSPAVAAALAYTRPVQFDQGFYGHTGGWVIGRQQEVYGAGVVSYDFAGALGTTLVKQSGTAIVMDCNNSDPHLHDFTFDANDLDGNQIRMDGMKYGNFERIGFLNQGATTYALECRPYDAVLATAATNVSTFSRLIFDPNPLQTSGGHIKLGGSFLYGNFYDCVIGDSGNDTSTGFSLTIGDSNPLGVTSQTAFHNCAIDGAIQVGVGATGVGAVQKVEFIKLTQESGFDRENFVIQGDNTSLCNVKGYRSNWTTPAERSYPFIIVRDQCKFILIEDAAFGDAYVGGARRSVIFLNGADGITIRNALAYSPDLYDFILMEGTTSTNVIIENVNWWVVNTARHIIKATNCTMIGGNVETEFTVGNGTFNNIGTLGGLTLGNVGTYYAPISQYQGGGDISLPGDVVDVVDIFVNGNVDSVGFIQPGNGTELTISAGVVNVTGSNHKIDTEADAAADDLVTITGGLDGAVIYLHSANDARAVTVKDGTGNIFMAGDFVMDSVQDMLVLIYDSASGQWREVSRSSNA